MIMTTLIAILLPLTLGFFVIALVLKEEPETGLLERLALAYPLGLCFVTMQMFLLGLLRIPLTVVTTTLPIAIEILALLFWAKRSGVRIALKPSSGLLREITSSTHHWLYRTALAVLMIWAGVKIGSVFLETGLRPIFAWDAWANWSAGAKAFYYSQSLLLDAPAADFFGRGVVSRITAYPLHNTLTQVWLALWAGSFDEVLVKFSSPFYLLTAALYLYAVIARETSRIMAAGMLVIFLGSPLLSYHAIELYSDLPLGVFILFAIGSFLRVLRGKNEYLLLTGLFSAGALFTKDEALFFAIPLLFACILHIGRMPALAGTRKKLLLQLLIPLSLAIPWFLFKLTHKLTLGAEIISFSFTFQPDVILSILTSFAQLDNFNVMVVFFGIFLITAGKPKRELVLILIPIACLAAFFVLVYSCTSFYYETFMLGTVLNRNVLVFYPVLCLLSALLIKRILSATETGNPVHSNRNRKGG